MACSFRTFAPLRQAKAAACRQRRRQAVALRAWLVRRKYCPEEEEGVETQYHGHMGG